MDTNEISFENLPQAVAHLANEIATVKYLVQKTYLPEVKEPRIAIGIDEACKVVDKAKSTVYTLCRKRILPSYKKGKKLYFFRDELLEWIENGRRKTMEEINDDSQSYFEQINSKK